MRVFLTIIIILLAISANVACNKVNEPVVNTTSPKPIVQTDPAKPSSGIKVVDVTIKAPVKKESLQVEVTDTPFEWDTFLGTILAALFGAVFGAISTFLLNMTMSYKKLRDYQHEAMNDVYQMYVINTERLLNIKNQLLNKHNSEFVKIKRFILRALSVRNEKEFHQYEEEWYSSIIPMLDALTEKDPTLNGLMVKWDVPGFIEVQAFNKLIFFSKTNPDDLRIFENVDEQIKGFIRTVVEKNQARDRYEPILADVGGITYLLISLV